MSEVLKDYGQHETVTKFDAARRQLHTAIHLFFANEDMVSVHTLTRASHDIWRTLLSASGRGSFFKDSAYIKPERRKEFIAAQNHPSNFLKHADRDPDEVLTLHHLFCVFWLLDCCMMYRDLTEKLSRECAIFYAWFCIQYPDYLADEAANLVKGILDSGMLSKSGFTKEFCLEAIQRPSSYPLPKNALYEDDLAN